ncbi:alpha,alpha-trehalase [Synchytrium microbalum]|uniref:Trehalase n=1 Tax=Synchytrium microbalum TaxID=1806994 RepID=A0A507BYP4_9FUNG|nr:alpha,alpha-trehalase [Synchytrium microbalum]TPX32231.1 alpha,alpha-trehalase [Synchytrium microbalum]
MSPLMLLIAMVSISSSAVPTSSISASKVLYTQGQILDVIQRSGLFAGFVDAPTKRPLEQVLRSFQQVSQSSPSSLSSFLNENFAASGSDVVPARMNYPAQPSFLKGVQDSKLRDWAKQIHHIWPKLARKWTGLLCDGCVSSFDPAVSRQFVVPGGMFEEQYYWDTYFTTEGLLLSEAYDMSKDMLLNFLDMLAVHGFVPNGSRTYYLNRSQPPFLILTIARFLEFQSFDELNTTLLEQELTYWSTRPKRVEFGKSKGYLSRYFVTADSPRPEAYNLDLNVSALATSIPPAELFSELATGAETGWDFSSRWIPGPVSNSSMENLARQQPTKVIPIDLNSILLLSERSLASIFKGRGNRAKCIEYSKLGNQRELTIKSQLCDQSLRCGDLNIETGKLRLEPYSSEQYFAVWAGIFSCEGARRMISDIEYSLEMWKGGLPVTRESSGLQWDFPNVWAPLQYVAIQAMIQIEAQCPHLASDAKRAQLHVAQAFVTTAFCAWTKQRDLTGEGVFYENFDATAIGSSGYGAEYSPQVGFGWTNGVLLWMMNEYSQNLSVSAKTCPNM